MSRLDGLQPGDWSYAAGLAGIAGFVFRTAQRYETETPRDGILWSRLLDRNCPLEKAKEMLLNLSLQIRASLAQRRNSGAKNLAEAAKQYIQANYQNPDLSVETICSELHISQSYFSNLFKQETGKSCIQYLTSVRMDRAVELLRTTDDRTYLVAQKVGYDDANYFSYVFKKQFGISPTQFREVIHMAKKLTDRVEAWRGRASIRYTMFLSFTASAIIAVFLTGITLYLRFSSQLNTAIQAENQMVMEQVEQSLSTYLRDMLGLADSCSYNVVKGRNVQNEDLTGS